MSRIKHGDPQYREYFREATRKRQRRRKEFAEDLRQRLQKEPLERLKSDLDTLAASRVAGTLK